MAAHARAVMYALAGGIPRGHDPEKEWSARSNNRILSTANSNYQSVGLK